MNSWQPIHCANCNDIIAFTYTNGTREGFYCFLCAHSLADIAGMLGGHTEIAGIPGHNSFTQAYSAQNGTQKICLRESVLRWLKHMRKKYPSGILPTHWRDDGHQG